MSRAAKHFAGDWRLCPCCRRKMKAAKRRHRRGMVLMTLDHILRTADGGSNHPENLRPMCADCNSLVQEFGQCVPALIFFLYLISRQKSNRGMRIRERWRGSPLMPGSEEEAQLMVKTGHYGRGRGFMRGTYADPRT